MTGYSVRETLKGRGHGDAGRWLLDVTKSPSWFLEKVAIWEHAADNLVYKAPILLLSAGIRKEISGESTL